ncbi:MAG: hypothetical protein LQ346_007070 [Caloplaca aetnensis]|nr:MAG: hypothetical protein LQ346_007070 [Caloplaca aetnensis]
MSFQRFDTSPPPAERTESKRPHLSVFRFTSFQSTSRRPSQTPPAYSPNDAVAARVQLQAKILHCLRIALSTVILLASIVVIACTARALDTYATTKHDAAAWVLPLWPARVDLRPTHALLACAIILAITNIFYIIAALAPTPLRSFRTLNLISTIIAFLSVFLTIFTTAYASAINSHLSDSTESGTLSTWSCRWRGFGSNVPAHFPEICVTSSAALNLVILMIVIEVFSVLLAGWGWWVGARLKKAGGERSDGKGQAISV